MPIYEYTCANCAHKFETLAKFEDKVDCASCGSSDTKRLISNTAPPVFRGTGFYQTDYKKTKINPEDVN